MLYNRNATRLFTVSAIDDHPLRIARIKAGLTAEKLGELAGVSRGTVNALEQGRIRTPRPAIVRELAERNGMTPERLLGFYDAWLEQFEAQTQEAHAKTLSQLSPKARAVLALSPEIVPRYGSFTAWRRDVMPSAASFASLLLLSATTLRRFEKGEIPMPKPLIRALSNGLRLSDEYIAALMTLEGSDPEDSVRDYWRDQKRIQRQHAFDATHTPGGVPLPRYRPPYSPTPTRPPAED